MRVAFVGTGRMGLPMARNLARAGTRSRRGTGRPNARRRSPRHASLGSATWRRRCSGGRAAEAARLRIVAAGDAEGLEEVLSGTLLGSPASPAYARQMVEGRFDPPGMRMRLRLEDVRLALAAAEAVPMPIASLLRDSPPL